jgi:exopolysaccharide biosynthesis polyprenyl glycosylphosphotransferase
MTSEHPALTPELTRAAAKPIRLDATRRKHGRGWLVRRMLAGADVLALCASFALTELLFAHVGEGSFEVGPVTESMVFLATLPLWILGAQIYGLYDRDDERAYHSTVDELVSVFHLVTVCVFGFFALSWLTGLTDPSQKKLATFWLLTVVAMTTARAVARAVARRLPLYVQNTVVVGAGTVGQLVGRKLFQHPEYGMNVVGFVDTNPKRRRGDLAELRLLGGFAELRDIVRKHQVDRVILAFSNEGHQDALAAIRMLRDLDVQVDVVPRLYEALGEKVVFHSVEGLPLLGLPPVGISRPSLLVKRLIDVVGAGIGLLFVSPLFAFIALRIKLDSPGPVFFRQARLGMNMREFTVLKFRTMRSDADEGPHREYIGKLMNGDHPPEENNLYKLDRSDEVTAVGRWLRRTSLDELPQLVNVLRGEMSLVGPRPCIRYELEYFEPYHFDRFRLPAGLTGLWQVTARAHATPADALGLDVAYARSWSLGLDLRLLARTPLLMLRKRETQ